MNMRKLLESIDRLSIVETTNVTDFNPPSQGKTRKELLAKFKKTKDPKDGEKARKAGATQKELQDARQSVAEGGYPEVDHMPGKRGIGLDRAKPKDTYVKTFHASKEKEAREFAKKHGYTVKKHVYPKSANNTQPYEFQVHKNGQGVAEGSKEKTPGIALTKAYKKDFDDKKPGQDRKETALTGTYSKTGKPGGELKKQGVAEGFLDMFKKKPQKPEDPRMMQAFNDAGGYDKDIDVMGWQMGWKICASDPSADPKHVFQKLYYGGGSPVPFSRKAFMMGFNACAKEYGVKQFGDVGNNADPASLQYKEFKRDQGVAEGSEFEDAYGQGYSDGYDGKRYNNPFPVGSDHDEYEDGYGSGRLDYNKMNRDLDEQSVAEGKDEKIAQLKKDHATAVHWSKNETSPQKREAARQKAEKIKRHLETQYRQGVAEGKDTEVLANEVYVEFERVYPQLARRADERTVHAAIMDVLNYGGDNNPAALAQDVARAVKRRKQGVAEGTAGPDKCWPNHRKVGTQPGTGKNTGKRVNDCEKIKK